MGKMTRSVKRFHDGEVKGGESWQLNKSVIECNRHMLDTGLAADVTFRVSSSTDGKGEVHSFNAHKYMLISRSPVFYSMFCGGLAEMGEVTVTDVEPEAFRQMLSYIYTGQPYLNQYQVMFILYASKKYLLPGLTTKCVDYLKDHLDTNNACTILDQSIVFDVKDLQDRCMKFIKNKTAALKSDSLTGVKQHTLSKILDSEVFTISEVDVFEACLKWARNRCDEDQLDATGLNMRKALGDCVNKFRFTNIEISDFARVVAHSNILTKDEEVEIFRYIAHSETFAMPSAFTGENRYFTPPFEILTDETPVEQSFAKTVELVIDCDTDVEIKTLIIGKSNDIDCYVRGSIRSVTAYLENIIHNNKIIGGIEKASGNGATQKWACISDEAFVIKAGKSSLDMCFTTGYSRYKAKGSVFVIPKQEVLFTDKHIKIKLSSSELFIPLLGLVYEIV